MVMVNRLWITYAWADNVEGDFDYLVQELGRVGVDARYDKVELIPGRHLWEQIGDRIVSGPFDGWAYLITPNSVNNKHCREELGYALLRALDERGEDFPLIGLIHQVDMAEVPPSLRIRLCVNLASPDWKEQIVAGVEGRPPKVSRPERSEWVVRIHRGFGSSPKHTAIEVRPRFGEFLYWRFAIPDSCQNLLDWNCGPAGGGQLPGFKADCISNAKAELTDGSRITWFGAGARLSPSISAYAVFDGDLPDRVWFTVVSGPSDPPKTLQQVYPLIAG